MEPHGQYYSPDLIVYLDPFSPISETFKTIRTNIDFSSIDKQLKTIAVTSTCQAEGKSTVSANLAIAYAQVDKKVLLLDADLRRPNIHKLFGLLNRRGLTSALISKRDHQEFIQETLTDNLYVLTSGPIPPNPTEMLMSAAFSSLIETLKSAFDLIIIDAPPVMGLADAVIISAKVDGMIYVVRVGVVDRKQLQYATNSLKQIKANVIGFVLNGVKQDSENYYYAYNYNYSSDSEKRKKKRKKTAEPYYEKGPVSQSGKITKSALQMPVLRAPTLSDRLPNEEEKSKIGKD